MSYPAGHDKPGRGQARNGGEQGNLTVKDDTGRADFGQLLENLLGRFLEDARLV